MGERDDEIKGPIHLPYCGLVGEPPVGPCGTWLKLALSLEPSARRNLAGPRL